ncbi:YitT family protein [Enterococcus sp.]|uniref:YitT family protein n=1 Tax=Enterococcus sp. TaxID=35783 RepID=UPI003C77619F
MEKMKQLIETEGQALAKVTLGTALLGFAYAQWMKPNAIINGGVTSLSMIANELTGLPLLLMTNGITLVLLILSGIFLGRGNLLRSVYSSICYNLFFSLFYLAPISAQINLPVDFLFASLFIAAGYALCLSSDTSTVGLDVVALIVHRYRPKLGVAKVLRWLNWSVLVLGLFAYNWQAVVIGIAFSYFNSLLLGLFLQEEDNPLLRWWDRFQSRVYHTSK